MHVYFIYLRIPDLSPIELAWPKIKNSLRTATALTSKKLHRVICQTFRSISNSDVLGCYTVAIVSILFIKCNNNNQLTCIDCIEKLRIMLLGLPYEDRYEIFELTKTQGILDNFNVEDILEIYELFLRENLLENRSIAHNRRIQYAQLTQNDLLGNPQFFNRLPAHNTSSDDEGYSSASEAPQNRNLY